MNGWFALIAFFGGFVVAQTWKFIVGLMTERGGSMMTNLRTAIGYMTRSGGMPSGHTASMVGLSTFLGLSLGFDSDIFALAVATTCIVMYDAIHVRYAVGVQGEALNGLLRKAGKKELPIIEGHTVGQVFMGGILGILIGFLVFCMFKC